MKVEKGRISHHKVWDVSPIQPDCTTVTYYCHLLLSSTHLLIYSSTHLLLVFECEKKIQTRKKIIRSDFFLTFESVTYFFRCRTRALFATLFLLPTGTSTATTVGSEIRYLLSYCCSTTYRANCSNDMLHPICGTICTACIRASSIFFPIFFV